MATLKTQTSDSAISSDEPARAGANVMPPRTRASEPAEQQGASPSNTAPANYIDTQILRTGIDSLYLSYAGELRSGMEPQLEARKALAQAPDALDQKEATILLSNQSFAVLGKGRGPFPFVLANNWYQIGVFRAQARKLPLAHVQIGSEVLTCAGLDATTDALRQVVEELAGNPCEPSISRVDLCVDFLTDSDLEAIPRDHWITRSTSRAQYYDGGQFSGYVFGQGGPVSCRIYDKTLELKKSNKYYLHTMWQAGGWNEEAKVWRIEFQLRNTVLREFHIRTLDDLKANMNSLWDYCTGKWLKLCVPSSSNVNQSRWPLDPRWHTLSQATFADGARDELCRVASHTAPSDHRLFVHGLGAITSFMAREGLDKIDDALPRYLEAAHAFHRRQSQYTGKTLNTYVREKVQQKRTRFSARTFDEFDPATGELKEDI